MLATRLGFLFRGSNLPYILSYIFQDIIYVNIIEITFKWLFKLHDISLNNRTLIKALQQKVGWVIDFVNFHHAWQSKQLYVEGLQSRAGDGIYYKVLHCNKDNLGNWMEHHMIQQVELDGKLLLVQDGTQVSVLGGMEQDDKEQGPGDKEQGQGDKVLVLDDRLGDCLPSKQLLNKEQKQWRLLQESW